MACRFELSSEARRQLGALEPSDIGRILKKLEWFSMQDEPLRFATRLHGYGKDSFRFRIGDYRAIANVDQTGRRIIIVRIGLRRDVYR